MEEIRVSFNEKLYSTILNTRITEKYEKIFDELGCCFISNIICDNGRLMIDHFGKEPCIWLTLYGPHDGYSDFILNLFNIPFINEGNSFGKIDKKLFGYNMDILNGILDKVVDIYRSGKAEYTEVAWCKSEYTYYDMNI